MYLSFLESFHRCFCTKIIEAFDVLERSCKKWVVSYKTSKVGTMRLLKTKVHKCKLAGEFRNAVCFLLVNTSVNQLCA